jgi:hypothetical protein
MAQKQASDTIRAMLDRRSVLSAMTVATLLVGGCGAAFESNKVGRKFESMYGCQPTSVTYAAEGWWATGCGHRAHYTCFDTGDDDSALASLAFGSDVCMQDHHEHLDQPLVQREREREVVVERSEEGVRVVRTTIQHGSMTLALAAAPTLDAERVVWDLRVPEGSRADAAQCTPAVLIDGVPLLVRDVRHSVQARSHRYRFTTPAAGLYPERPPLRVTIAVCEADFVLDDEERDQLARYAVQVREVGNRDAAAQPTSGAEVPLPRSQGPS